MTSGPAGTASPFGVWLRRWRRHRGLSQLALAGQVGSTSRHISFLETGRSRPSQQMVLRLGEALAVPLRERNQLLAAAGLPAAYPHAPVAGPELAAYRAAIDRLLAAHDPYPGMLVDGHWNVLAANRGCAGLFGADLVGVNLVRQFVANPAMSAGVVNWPAVAWAGLARLREQAARAPLNEELRELVALTEAAVANLPRPAAPGDEFVVCPWFRVGDRVVRTIGMAARFDPVAEITLDELRVELIYPLDQEAEQFFRDQASTVG
jgi:transcriptional regulator with XRE-family HTH domain